MFEVRASLEGEAGQTPGEVSEVLQFVVGDTSAEEGGLQQSWVAQQAEGVTSEVGGHTCDGGGEGRW